MKTLFSNATVMWEENEILRRESLIREISSLLLNKWQGMNSAVRMMRVETPVILPASYLQSHIDAKFDLMGPVGEHGYLRPETTVGSYEAFKLLFPQVPQILKAMPFCVWQVGLSFRDEANGETMRASKLRLRQFYQMEFQLFLRNTTKAPFLAETMELLTGYYGGTVVTPKDLPHYSRQTLDWEIDGLEVAGCSMRTDFHPEVDVCEIAIGLDRLVAMQLRRD